MNLALSPYLKLAALALTAGAALIVAPGSASAATTFSNTAPITINAAGPATPSASSLDVSGVRGPVASVDVTLNNFGHDHPNDVDFLLVSPSGRTAAFFSDACGTTPVEDYTWTIADRFGSGLGLDSCENNLYSPTNHGAGGTDVWPGAPAEAGTFTNLSRFNNEDPNGTWRLFVVDDRAGEGGDIEGGWSLSIETVPTQAAIPDTGTEGAAGPYPLTQTITGRTGVLRDVNVTLEGIYHKNPDDLDVLLVSPSGDKVLLASDACGSTPVVNAKWSFNDGNPAVSDAATAKCASVPGETFSPTDYEPGDVFPASAPAGPYSTSLSAFNFTEPNGDWKLYVNDDAPGAAGFLVKKVGLSLNMRAPARTFFADPALQLAEGATGSLTIKRDTFAEPYGPGAIKVTTQPATAASGTDFTPVTTTVQFAAGEKEKTVPVEALVDRDGEDAETFSVALSEPTGDAGLVGTVGTTATVTIPANAAPPADPVVPVDPSVPVTGGGLPQGPGPVSKPQAKKPVVTIAPGKKIGRDGRLKVRVRCTAACAGRVVLTSSKKKRKVKLGSAPFRLAGAGVTTLKVKVPKKGRVALGRAKRIKVTATARVAS